MNLDAQIESILFWKGEPIKLKKLADMLQKPIDEIDQVLEKLVTNLQSRGLTIVRLEDEVSLGTHPDMSEMIMAWTREEITRDLGRAGLETLAIILYKGPVARSEIDYVRGVNSQFILRNLIVRGLVERVTNPSDERSYLYKPTFDLLSHMGLSRIEDLPEFDAMRQKVIENIDNLKTNE